MNGHSTGEITFLTRSYRCAVARSTSGVHSSDGIGNARARSAVVTQLRVGAMGWRGPAKSSGPWISAIGMPASFGNLHIYSVRAYLSLEKSGSIGRRFPKAAWISAEPPAAEKGSTRIRITYPHIEHIEYSTLRHASLGAWTAKLSKPSAPICNTALQCDFFS